MANRHALLIGVPTYDEREFNRDARLATAVEADMTAMRAALEQSDYQVTECGLESQATGNRIKRAIKEACADAPENGVLLIYFSGHGVSAQGDDYLVPSDAYLTNDVADLDSLIEVIPRDSLRRCRARLVVFFVDACRVDPARPRPASELGGDWPFPANGQFVLVMGCGAGQVCQYDENGSTFTAALTKVLDPRDSARTVSDVVGAVSRDMRQRSRQQPDTAQELVVRYPNVLDQVGTEPLCAGDELTDAWIRAVQASPLHAACAAGGLADQVCQVVRECARLTRADQQQLAARTGLADPWTDQDYPGRVLEKTALLLGLAPARPGRPELTPGEAAFLVAAPFLRETVISAGLREAAAIAPANLDRTYEPGPRTDLELTHEMHQHLVRRAVGLRESGRARSSDQLAMWLVHQWLASRSRLWEEPPAKAVFALGAPLIDGYLGNASPGEEQRSLVQALLLTIAADPADERLIRLLGADFIDDRWRGMGAVLWLAGIMAADPRRLPAVVPDLVGTGIELPPRDVQDASRQAKWEWKRAFGPNPEQEHDEAPDTLDLFLVCDHPALHDAFDTIVRRADQAREVIEARVRLPAALAGWLPRRFTAARLRPRERKVGGGIDVVKKAYEVPLSRFQIAEEKVRELLMGRQLYGDPALAIRELYQNALDACRWRQTRFDYLTATDDNPRPWSGVIRFSQGTDPAGRSYIECEDNGVGMDFATLKHVFANAGERFVFGQEFRSEQAAWAELDPPLHMVSNSQFGIGVFSYFMLADEITVTTRHQRRDGQVALDAYEVSIVSSGSLIQIGPGTGLPEGGTRVRLYLSGDATRISVLKTLRAFLVVSEHRVEVADASGSDTWLAGEYGSEWEKRQHPRQEQPYVEPVKWGHDLWWVAGNGGLLADGIDVDHSMFGLVINLRAEHRPQFTVDRNQMRSWDGEWVARQARAAMPALMSWPGFTFSWLWALALDDLGLAQSIFEYAVAADRHLAVSVGSPEQEPELTPAPLRVIGCLPADDSPTIMLGRTDYDPPDGNQWFSDWRAGTWRGYLAAPGDRPGTAHGPQTTEGFPVADPIDAAILADGLKSPIGRAENISGLLRPHPLPIPLRSWLRRLHRYAITGLDLSAIRPVPALDVPVRDLGEADRELITVLDAWAPPGEHPRRELTLSLVRVAASLETSLGDVIRRAQALARSGWSAPRITLGEYAERPFSHFEIALLSVGQERPDEWDASALTLTQLAVECHEHDVPLDEGFDTCRRLSTLGVSLRQPDAWPRDWNRDGLNGVKRHSLDYVDYPGQELSLLQLMLIASQGRLTVGETCDALSRFQDLGLLALPDPGPFAERGFTRQSRSLLARRFSGSPGAGDMEAFQARLCLRIVRIVSRPLGSDTRELSEFARDLIPVTTPARPFTVPEIIELAYQLKMPLGQAVAALLALYPRAVVPELPASCADLVVPGHVYDMLTDSEQLSLRMGPGEIVSAALAAGQPLADFVASLVPFREFGAPLPALSDAALEQLKSVDLDAGDADMLFEFGDDGRARSLRSVEPLTLIQIAGRLGWTPAHAHWRLARLSPLGLTLSYPVAGDLSDQVVYWYDLLALTTYFDGQAPAVSGRIDWPYLRNAAEEIFDCPPDEAREKAVFLRDRLRGYAALFALELPEEPPGAETPVE